MNRSERRLNMLTYADMLLEVRDSVQSREQSMADGRVIYLSLFDAEIELRFSSFKQSIDRDKDRWLAKLELTDAVIHQRLNGEIVVYQSGRMHFYKSLLQGNRSHFIRVIEKIIDYHQLWNRFCHIAWRGDFMRPLR